MLPWFGQHAVSMSANPLTSPSKFAECAFLEIERAGCTKAINQCIGKLNSPAQRRNQLCDLTDEFVNFEAV